MKSRTRFAAAVAAASMVLLLPAAAHAQQVTGLEVRQDDGFATLSWDPVAGATEYQIERAPAGGTGVVVGVWRPNRQVNQSEPAFADAGFNPGDELQWRVRAVVSATPQPYSAPVSGETNPEFGDPGTPGENLRTQWEETNAASFTSDVNEYAYTAALDAASDRVRVVEIGRTELNRPINMFIIGHPAPKPTRQAVAGNPAALLNCNVHGNEPSSREGCLIIARELAFSEDPRTLDLLRNMNVLIVPAINGDGRAANTRGNSTGQDLNRDHSLLRQPETFSLAAMVRDYSPEIAYDGHEFGNNQAGDLPTLWPRHLNVAESIMGQSKSLVEDWLYTNGSEDGWWYLPVRVPERRRGRPQPGDDPAQHDGPQEHGQHAAGGAQLRRPDAARRGDPGEQPPAQDVLGDVHDGADARLLPREPARDRARDQGLGGVPEEQHGPDRVPGQLRRPGVPGAAPGRGPAAGRAGRGRAGPAAVRLSAHERAVRRARRTTAGRRPTAWRRTASRSSGAGASTGSCR